LKKRDVVTIDKCKPNELLWRVDGIRSVTNIRREFSLRR
jgi:hypothetical protein